MHDPNSYEYSGSNSKELESAILNLIQSMEWKSGNQIMDYGCGPGIRIPIWKPYLKEYQADLHCVDISESCINHAKDKYSKNENKIHFYHDTVQSENFALSKNMQKFDKIFAIYVFNWIKDPRKALHKLYDCLNSSGYIAFIVPSGGNTKMEWEILELLATDPKWSKYMTNFQDFEWMKIYEFPEKVEALYKDAIGELGNEAEIVKFEQLDIPSEMEFEKLAILFRSFNPFLHQIPQDKDSMDDFLQDCKKYLRHVFNFTNAKDTDIVPVKYSILSVIVKKH